jgi:hypothetical protein
MVSKLDREGWSGRYDPKKSVVHLRYGGVPGSDLSKTLLGHELAHWASRVVYCDRSGKSRDCSYRGQHNKDFYKILSKIHKKLKTPKANASALEEKAGYSPPDRWLDSSSYLPYYNKYKKRGLIEKFYSAAARNEKIKRKRSRI